MVITMLKFEEIREQFLGQICEILVSIMINDDDIVDPGDCPVLVVNIEHMPLHYGSRNMYLFTLLHSFRGVSHLRTHYLAPDMLKVLA